MKMGTLSFQKKKKAMRQSTDKNRLWFARREILDKIRDERVKNHLAGINNTDSIMDWFESIVNEAFNESLNPERCLNECKNMYFCDKKKRHSGNHSEGGLCWE
jgi:hypothetical protein